MFVVLELTLLKKELVCVPSEPSNDILSHLYKSAYDLPVGR